MPVDGLGVLIRLVIAMLAGGVVTLIYRFTRAADETAPSFTVTLVLLSILIAMVTQVIGDNVARAFSLVGALSIVRFRTVVRDTQDTAYVIFAVAVGMAVGAGHPGLAASGLGVIGFAALVMRRGWGRSWCATIRSWLNVRARARTRSASACWGRSSTSYLVDAPSDVDRDGETGTGDRVVVSRSAPQRGGRRGELVKALNRVDGVQGVSLERMDSRVDCRLAHGTSGTED